MSQTRNCGKRIFREGEVAMTNDSNEILVEQEVTYTCLNGW